MSSERTNEPVITSYAKAQNKTINTSGATFAYRELGPKEDIPVIFFVHLAGTLDNWDPRIMDAIAQHRHVITFDQLGVGTSSGTVPDTLEQAADDAYTFITALGYKKIDIFSFSMGGMIAQDLIVKHPDLVRKLVLTGTGPRGGKDMDKVIGTTYWDMFRAILTGSDPKEFLFFNRDAVGKHAGKAFVKRLKERTTDRDKDIKLPAFQTQLKAIAKYGRSEPSDLSVITQPTLIANGDNDRMVPSILSKDLNERIVNSELIIYPNSGHGGIFQYWEKFAPVAVKFLTSNGKVNRNRKPLMTTTPAYKKKAFASTILLWMLDSVPRQQSMDRWKGPHSKIITASPGQDEYRQLHLADASPGIWPVTRGIETEIPVARKVDGVAEVTFQSVFAPLGGRKQTAKAYADEIHNFRRTLLYAGLPNSTRWYNVGGPSAHTGARLFILLRRRDGVSTRAFRRYLYEQLVPGLCSSGVLTELRTQVFMRWNRALWNTPNVAHDNPVDQQFHASIVLGFADAKAAEEFLCSPVPTELGEDLVAHASALHAYDMKAYRYKRDGVLLPRIEE
jgi:pimeloyl-ACP methyl ester carboxylesterase